MQVTTMCHKLKPQICQATTKHTVRETVFRCFTKLIALNVDLPPPPPPAYEEALVDASEWQTTSSLSSKEAIDALAEHINQNCCWGRGPMEKMTVQQVEPSTAYKYLFDSSVQVMIRVCTHFSRFRWNERRRTSWAERPMVGGALIDGPVNGPPPDVWDIECDQPAPFERKTYVLPVPHTDEVRVCWKCHGSGQVKCGRCRGRGHITTGTGDKKKTRNQWLKQTTLYKFNF